MNSNLWAVGVCAAVLGAIAGIAVSYPYRIQERIVVLPKIVVAEDGSASCTQTYEIVRVLADE